MNGRRRRNAYEGLINRDMMLRLENQTKKLVTGMDTYKNLPLWDKVLKPHEQVITLPPVSEE